MNGAPSDSLAMTSHPCWYCRWWAGTSGSSHSLCDRPGGNCKQAAPRMGCAFFEREAGCDDDAWEPAWPLPPNLVSPRNHHRLRACPYDRAVPLILFAPLATPEQLEKGLEMAREVFDAAGIDAREAWVAFLDGVRSDACSTWRLAQVCALEACGATEGELALADD
jgi:hypothetical protein